MGKGSESDAVNTIKAVEKAVKEIENDNPTTIIVITPHGPVFQDYIYISVKDKLYGDLLKFGNKNVKLEFSNNTVLVNDIIENAKSEDIFSGGLDISLLKKYNISENLDHGAIVPLYFIARYIKNFKLVHISIGGLPYVDLYRFGMCIKKAVEKSDEQVVIVASGDLSHKLSDKGPYGFDISGKEFDEIFVESVKSLDIKKLLGLEEEFCERAGECGLRSFIIMFGALDGYELHSELYSYEGPFGIGYSVAKFNVGNEDKNREILKIIDEENVIRMIKLRALEDPYVSLARETLEKFILEGEINQISSGLPEELYNMKAGVFVSIKKKGQLRGCIGTTQPYRKNIAEEIIFNSISAGTEDPRFDPISEKELDSLVYSVDVLNEAEKINSIHDLDVIKYGVIVRKGNRTGLLLPNLDGVDTPEKQVSIALQKAGIRPDEDYSMERFEVVRHK